ncbi:hypothetical protein DTQ70_09280 [Runella sp. SP2]|nr:hypothetical protein DTQ70_09280 [Runella sp. SP2]
MRAPSQDQIAGATPQRPIDYKRQAFLAVALSAELSRQLFYQIDFKTKKGYEIRSLCEPPAGIKPATY